MDAQPSGTGAPTSGKSYFNQNLFSITLPWIAGPSLAIWAAKKGKKGKFWWFMGGFAVAGAIGYIIDSARTKGTNEP